MKSSFNPIVLAVTLAACMAPGTAAAAPPANLAGTTWTVQANRNTVQLVINTQAAEGAPFQAICRTINGEIGIAPIRGWYCPSTGRIHFKHNNVNSDVTVRIFTGNLSDDVPGQPLYMAGTMTVVNTGFGNLGEFNFSAVK